MAVHRRGEAWVADFWIGGRDGRRVRKSASTKKLAAALEREPKAREFRGELSRVIAGLVVPVLVLFYLAKPFDDISGPEMFWPERCRAGIHTKDPIALHDGPFVIGRRHRCHHQPHSPSQEGYSVSGGSGDSSVSGTSTSPVP